MGAAERAIRIGRLRRPAALRVLASGVRTALLRVGFAAAGLIATAAPASGHALDPVLFELTERGGGLVDVLWKVPSARIPGVELLPDLPDECRRVGDVVREEDEGATVSRWSLDCGGGLAGRQVGVLGLEVTDALLRVVLESGAVDRRVLGASNPSAVIEAEPARLDVVRDYARLGVEHIAEGIDHLLFVFGLLLLAGGGRAVLATVTAFTVGHSVTLALAALQVVAVPQGPVEVLIAVSIYALAVELARPPGPTLLRRRPWVMAFVFGLLHGLGFAGALREAGLPAVDVPLALLSFNVGIEVGQVLFVAVVLAVAALLRRPFAVLPAWSRLLPVYAMGTASFYWILSRAVSLG